MSRLADRVFIVTGAAQGIGRAVAERLAADGGRIGLIDVGDADRIEEAAAGIRAAGGQAIAHVADVTSWHELRAAVDATAERWGRLDGMVNNAGINGVAARIEDYPEEVFDRVMAINVKGVWLGMRAAFPHLRRSGGAVVNISSIAGFVGYAGLPAYTASKHAVIGLTKSMALEGAPDAIRVTAICPSGVETPLLRKSEHDLSPDDPEAARAMLLANKPLGRFAEPEEVAGLCSFLLSDEGAYMTGSPILLDGGQIARP
jgi:3alpha(or 20beta)-hydroxysteroid dehydrogenase